MRRPSPKSVIKQKISGLKNSVNVLKDNKVMLSTSEVDRLIDLKMKIMLLEQKLELM